MASPARGSGAAGMGAGSSPEAGSHGADGFVPSVMVGSFLPRSWAGGGAGGARRGRRDAVPGLGQLGARRERDVAELDGALEVADHRPNFLEVPAHAVGDLFDRRAGELDAGEREAVPGPQPANPAGKPLQLREF